jgi:hypothetical protein
LPTPVGPKKRAEHTGCPRLDTPATHPTMSLERERERDRERERETERERERE